MNAPSQDTTPQVTAQITPVLPVYSVTGYKEIEGHDGPIFNATIRRDGRKLGLLVYLDRSYEFDYRMGTNALADFTQAAEAWASASGRQYMEQNGYESALDGFSHHLLDEMFIVKDAAKMRRSGCPVVLLMSHPEPVLLDTPGVFNTGILDAFEQRKPNFYLGLQSLDEVERVRQDKQYAGLIVRVL